VLLSASKHSDAEAMRLLEDEARPVHSYNPFVQIEGAEPATELEETRA